VAGIRQEYLSTPGFKKNTPLVKHKECPTPHIGSWVPAHQQKSGNPDTSTTHTTLMSWWHTDAGLPPTFYRVLHTRICRRVI